MASSFGRHVRMSAAAKAGVDLDQPGLARMPQRNAPVAPGRCLCAKLRQSVTTGETPWRPLPGTTSICARPIRKRPRNGSSACSARRCSAATQLGKPRIDIKLGGANIFLAQVTAGDGVNGAPTTPYQGLDHFGLAVSGIDAIAADLKKKGVEFTKEPPSPRPGIKICFLRGPQGISIELLDRDPKYS